MNRNLIALALTTVSIVIIAVLVYLGKISFNVGIVISVLLVILYLLVLTFLPVIVGYFDPKVELQIENTKLTKKSFQHVDGYQIETSVTNKGRRNCLNLNAAFKITDAEGNSPNLLYVNIDEKDGSKTITSREEPMRDIAYAWVIDNEKVNKKTLEKLKQKGVVSLLFPYETSSIGGGSVGRPSSFSSSECLLKLETATDYHITVAIKGEDSENNTVMKEKRIILRVLIW